MSKFEALQTISTRLNEIAKDLQSKKLNKEELEEFKQLSKKLYERAIILHYKAIEEQVFGKEEKKDTPIQNKSTSTPKKEVRAETPLPPKKKDGRVEFDFSGGFSSQAPEKKEETKEPLTKKEKEVISSTSEEKTETPLKKEVKEPSLENEKEVPQEDKTVSNPKYYSQFISLYKEDIKDKFRTSKIDKLQGAFGLNDRLLFVRELFESDTDYFQNSVEKLDNSTDIEEALRILDTIAQEKQWDIESSTVKEFAHFINRRHVQ